MKTAMQQMIDILQRQINHLENTREKQGLSEVGRGALFTLQSRLIDAEELLEAEKEQIIEAYRMGKYGIEFGKEFLDSDDYFTQTFKSDE